MTFKPAIWYPIAVVLSVFNLVSVAIVAEPWHATIHAVLALGFGLWAQRLRQRAARRSDPPYCAHRGPGPQWSDTLSRASSVATALRRGRSRAHARSRCGSYRPAGSRGGRASP